MAKTTISSLTQLSASESRRLIEQLEYWYGTDLSWLHDYYLYRNSKGKVHLASINTLAFPLSVNVNSLGLYFGTYHDDKRFRLSIEGSRLIQAKTNYVRVKESALNNYLTGENLFSEEIEEEVTDANAPFLVVFARDEAIGCVSKRDNEYLNYVSKGRKLDYNKLF